MKPGQLHNECVGSTTAVLNFSAVAGCLGEPTTSMGVGRNRQHAAQQEQEAMQRKDKLSLIQLIFMYERYQQMCLQYTEDCQQLQQQHAWTCPKQL